MSQPSNPQGQRASASATSPANQNAQADMVKQADLILTIDPNGLRQRYEIIAYHGIPQRWDEGRLVFNQMDNADGALNAPDNPKSYFEQCTKLERVHVQIKVLESVSIPNAQVGFRAVLPHLIPLAPRYDVGISVVATHFSEKGRKDTAQLLLHDLKWNTGNDELTRTCYMLMDRDGVWGRGKDWRYVTWQPNS